MITLVTTQNYYNIFYSIPSAVLNKIKYWAPGQTLLTDTVKCALFCYRNSSELSQATHLANALS